MASLNLFFSPAFTAQRRVVRTGVTATKSSGASGSEEKGFLDFIIGNLIKEDQFSETDPILKKVEKKSTAGRSSAPAEKKEGGFGFGGLFSKK